MKNTSSSTLRKALMWVGGVFLFFILLFVVAVLAIRAPWAQQYITDKAVNFVSSETGTEMAIEKLFITFRGDVQLEGVYLEDTNADTLVFMNELEAGVAFLPLINGNINISRVNWNGLVANVKRYPDSTFNFSFLIDAFSNPDKLKTQDTTAKKPVKLSFGPLDFSDFDLHYRDEIIGLDAKLLIGKLELDPDDVDIETLDFEVDELVFHNVTGSLHQWLPTESSDTTTGGQQPRFKVGDVDLKNINFSYRSEPDTFDLRIDLQNLVLDKAEVDLAKQHIAVGAVDIDRTTVELQLAAPSENQTDEEKVKEEFSLPDWNIEFGKLNLNEVAYGMKLGKGPETKGQFNVNDMYLTQLKLRAEDGLMESDKLQLRMNELSLVEKSGLKVSRLDFKLNVNGDGIKLKGLDLTTPNLRLKTDAEVQYSSLGAFFEDPTNAFFELNIAEADLSVRDAFYFAPQLREDTLIRKLNSHPVRLKMNATGRVDNIRIRQLQLRAFRSTELTLNGTVRGLLDTAKLSADIQNLNLFTTRNDLTVFLDPQSVKNIPDSIRLKGVLKGNLDKAFADLDINTSQGNVKLTADATDILKTPSAKGKLSVSELNAQQLFGAKELAPVSLKMDFDARGKKLEELMADVSITFEQLIYREYDYSQLTLTVNAENGVVDLNLDHTDENLDLHLTANADFDTTGVDAKLSFNLVGADLTELNLTERQLKVGADLEGSFKGKPSDFKTDVAISEGIIVRGSDVYRLEPIIAKLSNDADHTELDLTSEFINGYLKANTSLDSIVGSLKQFTTRLTSADSLRSNGILEDSLDVAAHFTITNSRILTEAILPKLTRLDSIRLDLEYHPLQNRMNASLTAPIIGYANYVLDSLGFVASADNNTLDAKLAFQSLKGGLFDVQRTVATVDYQSLIAKIDLSIGDTASKPILALGSTINMANEHTTIRFAEDSLILNKKPWRFSEGNEIAFTSSGTQLNRMTISNGKQQISVRNNSNKNSSGLSVDFAGFQLASISTALNPNDSLLYGKLNGTFSIQDFDKLAGVNTDLTITDLIVYGNDVGKLQLTAKDVAANKYDVNLKINGTHIDLTAGGELTTEPELKLDAKADLNRLDLSLVEGFTSGYMTDASGYVEAHTTVKGPISNVKYNGDLSFKNAVFTIGELHTEFALSDDRVEVNNEGVKFVNFNLEDRNGRTMKLNGTVDTRNLIDPGFDLTIKANNFQVLNSTRDDSDFFFGDAFIDADIDVGGSLSLPIVKAKAKLRKETDVTVIIPESQVAIEERKGLVLFKNMRDTLNTILEPEERVEEGVSFTGIDLIAYLEIDPETELKLIIDERSGDNIEIRGDAKLNLEMTPNGFVALSGNYEVIDGFYDMKFYGLARRKFQLMSGSRITWSGDPLAGRLDLIAKYDVKASASDLMTDQLAQADGSTQMKYRQALPFEVMLNVNGELLKPEISFAIDMPSGARGALDGNVYKRVRQLNETQSEVDKQVFSLIVLNRFVPQSFSADNGAGTEQLARSSASKLLSGQLNAFSAKYLKGVEVNFDVDSYTDYQTGDPQGRTELGLNVRKALFKDRLVVQVGGQVDVEGQNNSYGVNDILGDISLEYLLTEQGQYRLKAFRKQEFQDLVQGQVIVTGLSVLFNKSYNTWDQLFARTPKKEDESEGLEKEFNDGDESEEDQEESDEEEEKDGEETEQEDEDEQE